MRELTAEEKALYVKNRQGKDFILFAGLVHLAHEEGMCETCTEVVQVPSAENAEFAVVRALVTFRDPEGRVTGTWSGIGDASPANVGKMIAMHVLRMAETRAVARALRVALDVGYTSLEELGDEEDERALPARQSAPRPASPALIPPPSQSAADPPQPKPALSVVPDEPVQAMSAQQEKQLTTAWATLSKPGKPPTGMTYDEADSLLRKLGREYHALQAQQG